MDTKIYRDGIKYICFLQIKSSLALPKSPLISNTPVVFYYYFKTLYFFKNIYFYVAETALLDFSALFGRKPVLTQAVVTQVRLERDLSINTSLMTPYISLDTHFNLSNVYIFAFSNVRLDIILGQVLYVPYIVQSCCPGMALIRQLVPPSFNTPNWQTLGRGTIIHTSTCPFSHFQMK